MLGTLMLCWFARKAVQAEAKRPVLLHLFVYDAIGVLVTVPVVISGVLNVLGWGIVALYLFFAVCSAYLLTSSSKTV